MATGSISNYWDTDGYGFKIDWSSTPNVAGNYSTVVCLLYFVGRWSAQIGARTHTINIAGTSQTITSGNITTQAGNPYQIYLGSVTKNVPHASDGTLANFAITATCQLQLTWSSGRYFGDINLSGTGSSSTIARKSTVSNTSGNYGSACTITINSASTAFRHNVLIGNTTILSNVAGGGHSYTIPASWAEDCPSSTKTYYSLRVDTYSSSGGTYLGRSEAATLTATVPNTSTFKPTLSVSCTKGDTVVPASWGDIRIQNKSLMTVVTSASGKYSATIKSIKVDYCGITKSGASVQMGCPRSGDATLTVTVTDSRGYTQSYSVNKPIVAYEPPNMSNIVTYRCDAAGTDNTEGTYASCNANFASHNCNNNNVITKTVQYKLSTATSYGAAIAYTDGVLIGGGALDTELTYDVKYIISDSFTSVPRYDKITPAISAIEIKDNKHVSIACTPEPDKALKVGGDTLITGNLIVDGGIRTHYVTSANDLNNTSFVSFGTDISLGGITIPQSSKGTLTLVEGTYNSLIHDAVLNVTSSSGITYTAFRNGSTWTHGKGTTGKLLWQGSHNVGDTFTIPEFSSYSTFAIHLDGAGAEIIVTKGVGSYLSGGAAYGYSNSRYIYVFASKINSDGSITIYDSNITSFSNMSSSAELPVKYIYGLF